MLGTLNCKRGKHHQECRGSIYGHTQPWPSVLLSLPRAAFHFHPTCNSICEAMAYRILNTAT